MVVCVTFFIAVALVPFVAVALAVLEALVAAVALVVALVATRDKEGVITTFPPNI